MARQGGEEVERGEFRSGEGEEAEPKRLGQLLVECPLQAGEGKHVARSLALQF